MAQEQSVFKYSLVEVVIVSAVLIGANIFFYSANNDSQVATETTNFNAPIQVATNTKMDNTRTQPANMSMNRPVTNMPANTTVFSPTPTSTPEEINETNVSVRFVNEAQACSIIKGTITLKTQGKTFTARTGKKGFATFNKVPCGDTAIISVFDSETSYNSDEPARRKIPCLKSAYLGAFDIYYGNKLSEARANYCYNLNPN